jgi:Tetratricopeptide repeat
MTRQTPERPERGSPPSPVVAAARFAFALALVAALPPSGAHAQLPPGSPEWVGKTVFTRPWTFLTMDGKHVDDSRFHAYRVMKVDGPRLLLKALGSSVQGWIPSANVILDDPELRDFDRLTRDERPDVRHLFRGNVLALRRKYDPAIAEYNMAIEAAPKNAAAYNNRGVAWARQGNLERAFTDFNRAIELDPRLAAPHNNRGAAHLATKSYAQAILDLTRAIELHPTYAAAHVNLGVARQARSEPADANFGKAEQLDRELAVFHREQASPAWTLLASSGGCTHGCSAHEGYYCEYGPDGHAPPHHCSQPDASGGHDF